MEKLAKIGIKFIEVDGKKIYTSKEAEIAAQIEIEKDRQA